MRSKKPAVYGEQDVPLSVIQTAQSLDVPLYCLGKDYHYQYANEGWSWWTLQRELTHLPLPKLALQNAAIVLQVLSLLPAQLCVDDAAIREGLKLANQPGRWQVLPGEVTKILDVAHNAAATKWLAQRLSSSELPGKKTFAVVAMLADKDCYHTLAPLLPIIDHWYIASLAVNRGADSQQLARALTELEVNCYTQFMTVQQAYQQALANAEKGDRIVIFGSFYTVAEGLRAEGIKHVEWR
jgi:dihydrofolate synthase/folylpolyglutamate synthase